MIIAACTGAFLGFISTIPVTGPVSAIVFSHALRDRATEARWFSFGSALIESFYVFLVFWGANQVLPQFPQILKLSNFIGAILLAILAVYFFRSKNLRTIRVASDAPSTLPKPKHHQSFLIGAGLTGMNPTLLATWGATLATLYPMQIFEFNTRNAIGFSLGICVGVVTCFNSVIHFVIKHKGRLSESLMDRTLKAIGVMLGVFSLTMIVRTLL
jgi:threonine/homoserine/homoserine lactone efflux protein